MCLVFTGCLGQRPFSYCARGWFLSEKYPEGVEVGAEARLYLKRLEDQF